MASSSGWAMSSNMRLFWRLGNDALSVLEYIQKPKIMRGTEAQLSQFIALNLEHKKALQRCIYAPHSCVVVF